RSVHARARRSAGSAGGASARQPHRRRTYGDYAQGGCARMKTTAIALLLVGTLAAAPAHAQIPGGDFGSLDELFAFLRQLQQQIEQTFAWMWNVLDYTDAARESLAPILDRVYSAQVLARRIESLAAGLPARVRAALNGLAGRLRSVATPRPWTPRWVVEQVITTSPNGETAQ